MTIKSRLTILLSLLFILIMTGVSLVTYFFISDYRKNEFKIQMEQKAFTIADILFHSNESSVDFVDEIEKNTSSAFHEERILVYNDQLQLVYDSKPNMSKAFDSTNIRIIGNGKVLYRQDEESELFGKLFVKNNQKLIIKITATDKYGLATLNRIKYILLFSTVLGISLLIVFSIIIVERSLMPIYELNDEMEKITENNLRKEIVFHTKGTDEVARLSTSYNKMLTRLADAFENQRIFVQHASHELRTPLAVMLLELDKALLEADNRSKAILISLKEELLKLIDLTNSLLLLSKLTNERKVISGQSLVRVDEIVFDLTDEFMSGDIQSKIKIEWIGFDNEESVSVSGNPVLLRMMFRNLIENACKYAEDHTAKIKMIVQDGCLVIHIANNGKTISEVEQQQLFNPLFRASNASAIKGFGVGLSIVKRIAEYHSAKVVYTISESGDNQFTIYFPKLKTICE